jgi:hypothetical protein
LEISSTISFQNIFLQTKSERKAKDNKKDKIAAFFADGRVEL